MAKNNILSIIGAVFIAFVAILVIVSLAIFSPAQDEKTLSVSNPTYEEERDLSILPQQTISTSLCYSASTCAHYLKEKEDLTLEELSSMGLELNCKQIPCYIQGIDYAQR